MNALFEGLTPGTALWLCIAVSVVAVCTAVVATTMVITAFLRTTGREKMEVTLKLEMVQRGMSPDDIERVLKAETGASQAPQTHAARLLAERV